MRSGYMDDMFGGVGNYMDKIIHFVWLNDLFLWAIFDI